MIKTNQRGSAHAVIIVILVLALLGALGVVFYQNFIAKKPADTSEKQEVAPPPTLPTARLTFGEAAYTFSYPTDWIVEGAANKEAVSSLTLLSRDKQIRVHVTILGEDMKFDCKTTDTNRKLRYYEVSKEAVTSLGNTAYVVEAITDAEGGGYDYKIGLTQDGGDTHAAVGDPYCTVFNVGLASQLKVDSTSGKVTQPTILAEIDFPELLKELKGGPVKDMQRVKDLIATDNYKAAVKILESARKE